MRDRECPPSRRGLLLFRRNAPLGRRPLSLFPRSRSAITTCAPRCAAASAVARPIPLLRPQRSPPDAAIPFRWLAAQLGFFKLPDSMRNASDCGRAT